MIPRALPTMNLPRIIQILSNNGGIRFNSTNNAQRSNTPDALVHIEKQFEFIPKDARNKQAFMAAVAMYKDKRGRNHVEFINTALKFIKEYNVHKDLDTYKALLNIFPKGKLIPQNTFQRLFLHYPMQQNCCVKVLDEMEWNGVQPDKEIHDIVVNAFGEWNFATKKIKRMLYWMPKLKYSNKYLDRRVMEGKSLSPEELAGLALRNMCRDPGTMFSLHKMSNGSYEGDLPGWFVTAQSRVQQTLLAELRPQTEIFVRGPYWVYLMESRVPFITLMTPAVDFKNVDFKDEEENEDFSHWYSDWKRRQNAKTRTIHEQKDGTILAVASLFRNDNQYATLWLETLEKTNPSLSRLTPRLQLDQ